MEIQQLSAQRDFQIAKKFIKVEYQRLYKIQSSLLWRKYGTYPSTKRHSDKWLQYAYKEYELEDVQMLPNDKKMVFIMRNICDQYELQSFTKMEKRQIRCDMCQRQTIKNIYNFSYDGAVHRDMEVGKCCTQMILSLQRRKKVKIMYNGELDEQDSNQTRDLTI